MHPCSIYGQGLCFSIHIPYICIVVFPTEKDCDVFLSNPSPLRNVEGFYYLCRINLTRNMEQVNHPQHYTTYDVETLDMMIRIWGTQETISFCKLNAFKYRMRAGHKDNAQQDINKALWYENKMNELSSCNHE